MFIKRLTLFSLKIDRFRVSFENPVHRPVFNIKKDVLGIPFHRPSVIDWSWPRCRKLCHSKQSSNRKEWIN